jgi:GntR family transcriptional regulator of vanillate catabolism
MARGNRENSLNAKATVALRELVLQGAFEPGERVPELGLVERLGMSRTPLRVALLTLEHEGLLEMLPGGGFVVRQFTLDDVVDAIELRSALEGTAARFAAERLASDDELDRLRACVAELEEAVADESDAALVRYIDVNARFHAELWRLARSPTLARALAGAVAVPFGGPNALLPSQVELPEKRRILVIAQHQHRGLLDSIAAGHGARAEEIAREHARLALHNLSLVLADRELRERLPGAPLVTTVE